MKIAHHEDPAAFHDLATPFLLQRLLDSGKIFCFLNTDPANPTSNHIHRKLGYLPRGQRESYTFACPPAGGSS